MNPTKKPVYWLAWLTGLAFLLTPSVALTAPAQTSPLGTADAAPAPLAIPGAALTAPAQTPSQFAAHAAPAPIAIPGASITAPALTAILGIAHSAPAPIAIPGAALTAPAQTAIPEPYPFSDRYPAEISLTSPAQLRRLEDLGIDIAAVHQLDGSYPPAGAAFEPLVATVNVNPLEAGRLAAEGLPAQPIPNRALAAFRAYGPGKAGPAAWPTYDQYVLRMQALAAAYPDLVRLVSIGQSVQGRQLWLLKLSDHPDAAEDEPEFKYTSTMHGDEAVGSELTLRLAELLASSYGSDPDLTALVDELEIWLAPIHNPDGYMTGSRYNAHGVDLNRDFPDPINDPFDDPAGREPETQAFMQFGYAQHFAMGANYHTGALVVNYPWDGTGHVPSYSPDDALYHDYSVGYALLNPQIWNGGFPEGVTQGWEWYSIRGGMQDWAYVWRGEHHVTIEVSDQQPPPYSEMDLYWDNNQEAMLWWMARALTGLRGRVTDAVSGAPLQATLQVSPLSAPNTFITDPQIGDYHRLIGPGAYQLTASADCHLPQTLPVSVPLDGAAVQDFALQPLPSFTVSGAVTDAASGAPLQATVELLETSQAVQTDPNSGAYALSSCGGSYTLRVSAPLHRPQEQLIDLSTDLQLAFSLEPLPCTLLVDDDLGLSYQTFYQAALAETGSAYDTWTVAAAGSPTSADLAGYRRLVWLTGDDSATTLSTGDQANLAAYLDGGGRLFLSGQDIGYDIGATAFYADYLHAAYATDDTDSLSLTGLDFLSGLDVHLQGGDGADNQQWPSDLSPLGGATAIFDYPAPHLSGGVAAANQVVYLSFGFEAIDNAADRTALLSAALDYLGGCDPAQPDLSASSKQAAAAETLPGARLDYDLQLLNLGGATTATLTDTLPLSVTFSGQLTATRGLPAFADGQIYWAGPLAQGEAITVSYAVTVAECLTPGAQLFNQAWLDDGAGTLLSRTATVTVGNAAPEAPVLVLPSSGAQQLPPEVVLIWQAAADANCQPLTYNLYLGLESPPPLAAAGLSGTSALSGPLLAHTSYYWALGASDGLSESLSPVWQFTTANLAPQVPERVAPLDELVGLEQDLFWLGSDPDGDLLTYTVAFGVSDPPPQVAVLTASQYDPGPLQAGRTYYWSIVASDGRTATAGPTWSFSTSGYGVFVPAVVR